MACRWGLVLALAVFYLTCSDARILVARVEKDERALIPLSEAFAFGTRGHLDIAMKDITIWRRHDREGDYSLNNFGFFLSPYEAQMDLETERMQGKCLLNGKDLKLFTFDDKNVKGVVERKNKDVTFHIDINNGGQFYLYFANCEKATPVSFTVRVEMYNLVGTQGKKSYLSVGETELSVMYWVMFGLFALISLAWAFLLHRSKDAVQNIHYFMLALTIFKVLTLLSQALMYHFINLTGRPDGWNIVFYIFTFCRGLLFFTVIILIGTGWSYMKPFIDDNTKKILMVVVPLQVFANIAIVITSEESPAVKDWFTWQDIFHLVDIICCCAVLFPIVWSIKRLRDASETDGKAARCLEKLTLFRQFYVMVVIFIYFTRIVVFLIHSGLEYQYLWVADTATELATLAFYVWVGVKFRPYKENAYLKLRQEEIEMP